MAEAVARFAGLVPGVVVADTVDEALTGADAAALATEWLEFRQLDWRRAAALMRRPIIVDGRNALSPLELVDAGFAYASFGRGTWGTTEAVVETPLEQHDVPAPAERPETLRHGARETEERVRGFGLARGPAGVD